MEVARCTGARTEDMQFYVCGNSAHAIGVDGSHAQHPNGLGVFDFVNKKLLADWWGGWRFHFYK